MTDITETLKELRAFREIQENDRLPSIWEGSAFESIRRISSSKTKGTIAEQLVSDILSWEIGNAFFEKRGEYKKRTKSNVITDGDRIISSLFHPLVLGAEIKMSTAWQGEISNFKWQQIRNNQDYDVIFFLGVNPNSAVCWWATKQDLEANVFGDDSLRQHGGSTGNNEVYWVSSESSDDIPEWFRPIESFSGWFSEMEEKVKNK